MGVFRRLALSLIVLGALANGAEARAANGVIAVTCPLTGASVVVDGRSIGKTPLEPFAISAGVHRVTVRKIGHLEYVEDVRVPAGATAQVFADLLPIAGVIEVTANAAGARVFVDGQEVGRAPLQHEVKPGRHRIVVVVDGQKSYTKNFKARPGITEKIHAVFEVAPLPAAAAIDDPLELELAPIAPLPKKSAPVPEDDPLALEPLPSLDLAPLPNSAPAPHPAVAPMVSDTPMGVRVRDDGEQPWYKNAWLVGGAGAAILAVGVGVGMVAASGSGDGSGKTTGVCWAPGQSKEDGCEIIIGFRVSH